MAKKFDPKQQAVLDCQLDNQLVSAGAGSGKTTVMIRKIADLLLEQKIKPNEIVVLTFTVLASHEMKQRLIKTLNDELNKDDNADKIEFISQLLYELETASIDTIDGFCSKMCKKYFFKLNISPETTIATGLSLDYYVENSLDQTINEALKTSRQQVIDLADCFEKNARNLDTLKTNLLNTFNFIMAQKDYVSFLQNAENEYKGLYKSADFLNKYLIKTLQKHSQEIKYLLPNIHECAKLFDSLSAYMEVLDKINEQSNIIQNAKQLLFLPSVRFDKVSDEFQTDVDIIKSHFTHLKDVVKDFLPLTLIPDEEISGGNSHFDYFLTILKQFIVNYQATKHKYKVVDFLDLERMFLSLLDTEIKDDLFKQYKYIFVDEYQDINPMQDEIISRLKSVDAKIFFVGDVKQSIYGFRQSTPELFLEKYKQYKTNDESKSFDMNINFRSNPTILKFNNEIFSQLMTEEMTDIDYKKDAQFDAKRTDFAESPDDVEIAVFEKNSQDEEIASGIYSVQEDTNNSSNFDSEIEYIINKISNLVGKPFYDSNQNITRKMEYQDIAILTRSMSGGKVKNLVEALKIHHIPINISNKTNLNDCESVYLVYNILKVLNNNADDVALLTYLTCGLGDISLTEIYTAVKDSSGDDLQDKLAKYIAENNNYLSKKIKYAFDLIDEIKFNILTCNNIEIIDTILNQYHLKHYILNSKNGESELNSLNNFLSSLSSKEKDESLTEFIEFLKNNMTSKTEYNLNDGVNAITIQTIHASKGLEYPVVFLFNTSTIFKPNNHKDEINFDSELGIGMYFYDLDNRKKHNSIPRFAITTKNKIKCYKEELRLLYVATTRPKNKLIITGEAKFEKLQTGDLANNNFLELIYSVFKNSLNVEQENKQFAHCVFHHYSKFVNDAKHSKEICSQSVNINGKNIDFCYSYPQLTTISIKNNVTAISRELHEDYNIMPEKLQMKENLNAITSSNAEIGTNYHKLLAQINYLQPYSKMDCGNLDEKLIEKAYEKISKLAFGAMNIQHEAQFMMYVPYKTIYPDSDISNRVLVQGVVDLIIEFDDHIILVDYKHSKSNIKVLKDTYKTQLKLYKLAIEKAKNKKVTESYIYHINTGDLA